MFFLYNYNVEIKNCSFVNTENRYDVFLSIDADNINDFGNITVSNNNFVNSSEPLNLSSSERTTAVIETGYSGDMFELADLFSDKYDVVSVADSEIVLKK